MPTPKLRSAAGALAGAAAALWLTPAYPHAVCGDRILSNAPGEPIFTGARQ